MNEEKATIIAHVLLVDDHSENIHSLQTLLTQEGQNVHFFHALSGNEALKIAFKEDLALILLDVQMPEMDGYEVATILKQKRNTQNIPLIFVTALNQESKYVTEGYSKGAIDYLFKPLDPVITKAKFNSFINIYLQQKKLENSYKDLELIVKERTRDLQAKNEELVITQKELKVNNLKLTRLNQELDQFVYIASHDLKLPIANLEGLIEALQDDLQEVSAESSEIIQMLDNSVVQMKDTINGWIEIIQRQKEEEVFVEPLDGVKILEEVKLSISGLIAQSKASITDEMEEIQGFKFNRVVFKSVLYNLITNAIKYGHPERQPLIHITFKQDERRKMLSVKDNGIGMTEQEKTKLFKLFTRFHPHPQTEGNGMGLYNLKNMLTRYQATIDVSSEKGKGTEFVVLFHNELFEQCLAN
jgi:signal transduction histidine kinase